MSQEKSLQERFAPQNRCFGCGPANEKGLKIRSFPAADPSSDEVVLDWTPEPHHLAFEGVLNGGIIGTLMDCHSNWTAVWDMMRRHGLAEAPCCVTADFHVKLRKPTPAAGPVHISARAASSTGNRVVVEARMTCEGIETAFCRGTFVAVGPSHPAYQRW